MDQPKTFQLVVLGIFAVLILLGLLGFSGKLPLPQRAQDINYGEVTLWGTLPASVMQTVIADKLRNERSVTIKYVEKNKATFDRDFVEALASGTGPDLFMLGQDEILRNLNKIAFVPYQAVPERTFKDTFLQEGEMYLRPEGITALPFVIDPLVMYWNRDIFTNAGVVTPPTKWSEFYTLAPRMTMRDRSGAITQSFAPLGEYVNVLHAKEFFSTLLMQAGSAIVANQGGALVGSLGAGTTDISSAQNPAAQAVNFFTQFSRSDKDSYTWNRSLPYSRSMFEAGDLAVYFGFASEYMAIKQKNPHLNFDVALMPQPDQAPVKVTFGSLEGLAMVKASKNPQGALRAALVLSNQEVVGAVAQMMGLPPVRRDLLSVRPTNATLSVFYDAVLTTRAWYDPSPAETDQLFRGVVESVNSGQLKISQALSVAENNLSRLLKVNQ